MITVTSPTFSMPTINRISRTIDTTSMIMKSMRPRPAKSHACKRDIKINISQCCTAGEKQYVFLLEQSGKVKLKHPGVYGLGNVTSSIFNLGTRLG